MTEIEERAIYKRRLEIKEEEKQKKDMMQKALKDYVEGKIGYRDLPKRAQFFLSTNTPNPPEPMKTPIIFGDAEEEPHHKKWWQL